MAYDLYVGQGTQYRDRSTWVGDIEFDELSAISRLLKHRDAFFLHHVANLFDDQAFSQREIEQALDDLYPLLAEKLGKDERAMLHKLIAVLSFAKSTQQTLFGVAD